ncbi:MULTISPECIES: hypothetical protein [Sanguibacteroides]|nr:MULTISPECIES: hypothetical protein [Sanguibacteroides]
MPDKLALSKNSLLFTGISDEEYTIKERKIKSLQRIDYLYFNKQ